MSNTENEQATTEQRPLRRLLSKLSSNGGKPHTMQAVWNGAVIAESDDTVVVEGNHYFPAESLRSEHLRPSSHQSVCFWKGTASYYDVVVGDAVKRDAAWYYPEPSRAAQKITNRVAFSAGVEVHRAE